MKFKYLFILLVGMQTSLMAQVSHIYDNGVALFKQKDYQGTITIMSRVIKKSPYYFEAYTYRARAYAKINKIDSAQYDFSTALEKKPGYLPAIFYRAVMQFDLGHYEQSIVGFNQILASKPRFIKALIYRARALEQMGKEDEAIADFTKAINMKLKNSEVFYRRGLLYEKKRMYKSALWDYNEALKIAPKDVEYLIHRAHCFLNLKKNEEAFPDLSLIISQTDTIMSAFILRGNLYFEKEIYDSAALDYSYAINKFRLKDAKVFYKRAEAYFRDSNLSLANREYARVLKYDNHNDKAVVGQAKVNLAKKRPASAIPLLRKALLWNPRNAEAYFLRAKIAFDKKDYEAAKADFEQCVKYKEWAEAYYYLGSCKFEFGDKYGACLDLQKAKKLGYKAKDLDKTIQHVCR